MNFKGSMILLAFRISQNENHPHSRNLRQPAYSKFEQIAYLAIKNSTSYHQDTLHIYTYFQSTQ